MNKTVPQLLGDAAKTFEQRNKVYGSAYKRHGYVMSALLPDGVRLNSSEDFMRFGLLNMVVGKLVRYSSNFAGGGHADSIHDAMVYCAMLEEVDGDNDA